MEKNYVKYFTEGNKAKKRTKVIKYFERDEYGKQIVPEEKEVKENAVPKKRAEYVSVRTRSTNDRTDTIEYQGEIVKVPHLITPKEREYLKTSERLRADLRKARELFFSEPFKTIEALTFKMSKEGEDAERRTFDIHEFNNYVAKMIFEDSIESYRQLKRFHVYDPRQNNNYCIIDHVNSISGEKVKDENGKIKDVLLGELYEAAYRAAKEDNFTYNSTFTMKKFCRALNNCTNPSKQYKMWVRDNFYPRKVYLICDNITNYDARYAYKLWTDRKVDVMVIQADQNSKYFSYKATDDINRKVANTWSNAIGWSSEIPIYRAVKENNIDLYSVGNKSKRQELITRGVKVSKITTKANKFLIENRAVVTDKETKNIARNVIWKHKAGILNKKYIDLVDDKYEIKKTRTTYMLEMDQTICECCGKPRNIYNHKDRFQKITNKIICANCEAEFEDFEGIYDFKPYYEDSYKEDLDDYIDDIILSSDGYEMNMIED